MRILKLEHVIAVLVAAATVVLALAEGGFEPSAYALAAALAWGAVLIGIALGRLPRAEPPPAAVAAGLCLAAFAGLTALSLAWASDNGRAFEDVVRALAYLGMLALVLFASRRGEAEPWLRGLAAGLAAVGGLALLGRFEPGPFGDPDAELLGAIPAAAGRLSYPIGYWNGLAAAMATATVLLAWFGSVAASRWARALAIGSLPFVGLALWATDSRGGIVAAALAFAVLLGAAHGRARLIASLGIGLLGATALIALASGHDALFDRPGTGAALAEGDRMLILTALVSLACGAVRFALDAPLQRLEVPRRVGLVALGVVCAAAVVGTVLADPVQRWEDFKAPPTGQELSADGPDLLRAGGSGRYQFWSEAVDAFAEAPVAGQGTGDYGPYWLENREQAVVATRAHSVLFETLAELGLIGVALLGGSLAIAVVAGVRRLPQDRLGVPPALAVLGVGAAAAAVDWTWDLPAVFGVTVVAVALLTGPATLTLDAGPAPGRALGGQGSRTRFAAGIALLMVAWVSICAAALLVLSDRALERSRDLASRGDLAGAIEAADDSADVEPWAAEPRTQLALLYERGGDAADALSALDEAIERSPLDYRLYLLRARILLGRGDLAAARSSLARARELNPLEPVVIEQSEAFERVESAIRRGDDVPIASR